MSVCLFGLLLDSLWSIVFGVFQNIFGSQAKMFHFVSLVFRFCSVFSIVGLISLFEHACIEWYHSFFGSLRSLIYLRDFCFDFSVLESSIFRFFASPVMVSFFEFKLPPGKHHIHYKRRAYWKSFAGFRIQSVLSGVPFLDIFNGRIFWACRIFYIQLTNENFAKIEILKNSDFYKNRYFWKITFNACHIF